MEQKEQIAAVENPVETPQVEKKPKKKLSKIERKKLRVITKLIEGEINGTQAAKKLKLSTRQVRNLKRQVLNEGVDGVIHKNKNYKPYNTYDTEISTFITKLYRKEYRGTNFSAFARIVQDEYGITASRSTIYNFLRRGRIRSPQRKKKKRKIVVAEAENNTSTASKTTKKTTK
ncbi:MAG: helix-turn-helix domain-containing protein [Bacilli bacterium]|nr:helix-turn-helix domain-containing protein [Bacilli bacterium]